MYVYIYVYDSISYFLTIHPSHTLPCLGHSGKGVSRWSCAKGKKGQNYYEDWLEIYMDTIVSFYYVHYCTFSSAYTLIICTNYYTPVSHYITYTLYIIHHNYTLYTTHPTYISYTI